MDPDGLPTGMHRNETDGAATSADPHDVPTGLEVNLPWPMTDDQRVEAQLAPVVLMNHVAVQSVSVRAQKVALGKDPLVGSDRPSVTGA